MLAPSIPFGEAERLAELYNARILDTPIQKGFERITRITKHVFNMPIVAISLVDDLRVWVKSAQGIDICEAPREISFCGHTILNDEIFIVNDTHLDARFADNPAVINKPYIRFYAGYPIQSPKGYNYGVLCLSDIKPRTLSKKKILLFKDIAGLVETEILKHSSSSAQQTLINELDHANLASMVDPLTRLWNRNGMRNILNYKIEEYYKNNKTFAIAFLDIDHFKQINDTYGHDFGDLVLKNLANTLINSCRDTDAASRWGGEEFLILINNVNKDEAQKISERLRITIEKQIFTNIDGKPLNITATIGITTISPNNSTDIESLIMQADRALYEGKKLGRNKVVYYQL